MKDSVRQLSFLSVLRSPTEESVSEKIVTKHTWWLFTDGASRGNPGVSGAGFYIVKDGIPHYQDGYFLDIRTNNQAEYLALLLGLYFLQRWVEVDDSITIFSDSQLLVRQLLQVYRVKNDLLRPFVLLARHMVHQLGAELVHIPREENTHADHMANHGLDTKKQLPQSFVDFLRSHEVIL
jgi:ribonuclease HI